MALIKKFDADKKYSIVFSVEITETKENEHHYRANTTKSIKGNFEGKPDEVIKKIKEFLNS